MNMPVTLAEGFAWLRRMVDAAPAYAKLETFRENAREAGRWLADGMIDMQTVGDRLQDIAEACGLVRRVGPDAVQAAIEHAIENPLTATPRPNGAAPNTPTEKPLEGVVASSLADKPVPSRAWHVPDLIPANTVTILSGDGDAGKSLLAEQLAASTAARRQWIGRDVTGGRAIYFAAEDELDEMHRRLVDIAKAMDVSLADLNDLMIVPLVEEDDTILAAPDGKSEILKPTPLWHRVESLVAAWRPALVVFDPRADLFGGNEISRVQGRQFIGMLRRLAHRNRATALLLDHPSLSGMSSGSGSSGSTSWRNSSRSMMYLQRDTVRASKGEIEPDTDRRLLTSKKANYARRGSEITLRWRAGVFEVDDGTMTEIAAASQHVLHDLTFLSLVDKYAGQKRHVSATPGANYAPVVFAADNATNGISKADLKTAMNRCIDAGRLRVEEFGPPSRRLKRLVTITEAEAA